MIVKDWVALAGCIYAFVITGWFAHWVWKTEFKRERGENR